MFPPRWTLFPWARSISAIRVVVVVLPSLPVTPIMGQGQRSKNISRSVKGDAGGPEDDVLLQGPQIIIPQGKGDPGLLHLLADFPQLLPVLAVVDGDMDALCRQHPGDAVVGDSKAHQPHLSGAEHLKKIGDALFHSQNTCLP